MNHHNREMLEDWPIGSPTGQPMCGNDRKWSFTKYEKLWSAEELPKGFPVRPEDPMPMDFDDPDLKKKYQWNSSRMTRMKRARAATLIELKDTADAKLKAKVDWLKGLLWKLKLVIYSV